MMRMKARRIFLGVSLGFFLAQAPDALAQRSSLGARQRTVDADKPAEKTPRETPPRPRNLVYEKYGWTSRTPAPPKAFRPGDLITIIVREQRKWEADSDLETKRRYNLNSELDAFIKPTQGGIGAAGFRRGKPNIAYTLNKRDKSEGDSSREDKLTTRLTARILDVKPNGLLVLEGRAKMTHDEEISEITMTGTCRKEDVTADNTVLSTQIADKAVVVTNSGALHSAATRGWVTKLLDLLKPI
ncbi:MAG: flagellar basal body L-ring protein FlgH [Planctomycetota bacterium]|mgnify:FL=1